MSRRNYRPLRSRHRDDQLDRLSREIEQLKLERQLDWQEQERRLDQMIKELEGLKRELKTDPKLVRETTSFRFKGGVGGIY